MPRLPGPEALGNLPSLRGGGAPQISGSSPVAEGLSRVGQGMVALSNEQREREDALQAAEADARLTTGLTDLRRRFDSDGDWQTYQPRFQEEAGRIRQEAESLITNPQLRQRWQPRADVAISGAFDHVVGRQDRLRGEHEYDRLDRTLGELGSSYTTAPDETSRDTILRNMQDTIELGRRSGVVPAERIRDLTRRHVQGSIENDALNRPDSYAALLELREGDRRISAPSTGEISELGLSQLERSTQRQGMTAAQTRTAQEGLRRQTGALSKFIRDNLTEGTSLTQAQHDALVSYGVSRGEDALTALMPLVNSQEPNRLETLAQAMRQPGATQAGSQLGSVSARYESGGRGVGFISTGRDDPGGQSYGIHQLSGASSMGAFLRSKEGEAYRTEFGSTQPMTPEFNRIYARLAQRDPEGFAEAQRAFYTRTHYEPARQAAGSLGFDVSNRGIQEALFSIGVQHGGARSIIQNAAQQIGAGASVEDQVRALYDARTQYVQGLSSLPENTRQSVLNRYRNEARDVLAIARGETPASSGSDSRSDEYADLVQGRAPASRYSRLPPDRRRVLISHLEQGLRPAIMADMDDDLEQIRQTGEERRLPDGSTSFTRGARVLTRNQSERYQLRREEAMAQYRALNGLQDMTQEEIASRREQINPATARQSGERLGIASRTRSTFDAAVDRMREADERDPAQSVEGGITLPRVGRRRGRETIGPDGQPILSGETDIDHRLAPAREVAEAHALIRRRPDSRLLTIGTGQDGALTIAPVDEGPEATRARQDAWRIIIEGRLAAQARRGLPETQRSPITRAEATALLNMPRRVANDTEFENQMRAAADRADALYGPYARQALQAAIRFRSGVSNEQAVIAERAVRNLVDGTVMRPQEVARFAQAMQLNREEQAWLGRPTVLSPSRAFTDATGMGPMTVGPGGGSLFPAPAPQGGWLGSTPSQMGGSLPTVSPEQVDQSRTSMAMRRAAGLDAGTSQPSGRRSAARQPEPPPEEVRYLLQNPQIWREFDRDYGPGAAARYLQQMPQP